ncbi:MAG: hypothetical protein SVV03_06070 [Candidatus Nanohaloarchaea archaeon]|nr:hypothetical protein [Candidatus Nanohaloarchaea archaeon]
MITMELDFDSSYIIYGFGALLGVISLVYFGSEVILELSPTIKSFLLLLGFAVFFISGSYTKTRFLSIGFYLLSAASYVVFLFYLPSKFDFSKDQTFILIALSSVLFMCLGYGLKQESIAIGKKWFKISITVLLALGVAITIFDGMGARPTYSLDLEDQTSLFKGENTKIGELTVKNEFMFSREIRMPSYRGCLYLSKRFNVHVFQKQHPRMVGGGKSISIGLEASPARALSELNRTSIEDLSLTEKQSCPESMEEPSLVVVKSSNSGIETPYAEPRPIR